MTLNIQTIDKILKSKTLSDYHIVDKDDKLNHFKKTLSEYKTTIIQKLQKYNSETNQIPVFNKLLLSVYNYHFEIDINNIDISIWDNLKLKVIIEAKRTSNKSEMIKDNDINKKALHEALLYYYEQRQKNVFSVNHIMITDYTRIYLFNAKEFEALISNKTIHNLLSGYKNKELLLIQRTEDLYKELASILNNIDILLNACKIDLFDENLDIENTYRILDRYNLLQTPLENKEHNILDPKFYNELLYIMGLQEVEEKVDGKTLPIIKPLLQSGTSNNSNLMTMVTKLIERARASKNIDNKLWSKLGDDDHERYFNMALELVLTWTNRILFLKLLEAQLISYHKDSKDIRLYQFLKFDEDILSDWNDIDRLFFEILAKPLDTRESKHIPYLNSALFEETDYEKCISVSSLNDRDKLDISKESVLDDKTAKPVLQYLLEFLDSYNFGRGDDGVSESKRLINASVLGLIFEQLNGYKDGAIYTPSFITMSMSRDALVQTVIQKFNDTYQWTCKNIIGVGNSIIQQKIDLSEANNIFDSIRIVDPAVGSGHFLVSVLNELLYIKHHGLGILCDKDERLIRCDMDIISDELLIKCNDGTDFVYHVDEDNKPLDSEMQRMQETLFHEKETLIENCLFGVDINPKSTYICQLRLWIELLKNTYYIQPTSLDSKQNSSDKQSFDSKIENLKTLPNIDINIKTGNSLVSKFDLQHDFSTMMGSTTVKEYRKLVNDYKNTHDKAQKLTIKEKIAKIKIKFKKSFETNDVDYQKLISKYSKAKQRYENIELTIDITQEQIDKAFDEMDKAEAALDKADSTYINSMEWWYEFPEVLDDDGNFIGFDLVIGNPPYIVQERKKYLGRWNWTRDTYTMFVELAKIIVKPQGIVSFIIPKFWLVNKDNTPMRENLLKENDIIDLRLTNPFKKVVTENIILSFFTRKSTSDFIPIYKDIDNIFTKISIYNKQYANTNKYKEMLLEMTDEKLNLLHRITNKHAMLSDIRESIRGAEISKDFCRSNKGLVPILIGEDINIYSSEYSKTFITDTHKEYQRLIGWFNTPNKILLRRVGNRLIATMVDTININNIDKPFAFTKNLYAFRRTPTGESELQHSIDDFYILGLLNSTLLTYYYKTKFSTKKEDVYPEIQKYLYEQLPIPTATPEQQAPIIALVQQCMTAKTKDKNADISHLQNQIDTLVYSLYGLSDEEIKIVEGGK